MCMRLWGGDVEGACVCGCGVGMPKEHVRLWNEMWREHTVQYVCSCGVGMLREYMYAAVGWGCGGSMCDCVRWGGTGGRE